MKIDLDVKLIRVDGMTSAPVDQELVILNVPGNCYVALDEIGRRVWELLERPQSAASLSEQLGAEFDGAPEEISADVLELLEKLVAEGLVRITG